MSESEMIDLMLEFYVLRPKERNFEVNHSNQRMHDGALQKMKAYGLIEPTGFQNFNKATEKGYEAYNIGGIDKWIADKKQREDEIRQATLDSARATVDAAESAKWSKYAAIVSAVAAIVAFTLPSFLNQKSESVGKSDSTISAMQIRLDTLYLRLKAPSQIPKAKEVVPQTQKKK